MSPADVTARVRPRPFRLRGVVFDFDGTLTAPGALDFAAIKRQVGCPPDHYILEWIGGLPAGARRREALAALEELEEHAAGRSAPNTGAEEAVLAARRLGLGVAVLTRNGRRAVDLALARFARLTAADFDVIVTRDDAVAAKPAPDGVVHAAAALGVPPEELLVVGDFVLDMLAGRAAGAVTAFLSNGDATGTAGHEQPPGSPALPPPGEDAAPAAADCDFVLASLAELEAVFGLGLPLPQGKVPNNLLERHLRRLAGGDPSVLVGPGVGRDYAAVDVAAAEVMVVHGDPITLAGREQAALAVAVNANDVATSGARPRWLLTTVLLPPGTTPAEALALLGELGDAADGAGVALIGGHAEVSDAVTRPVLSCTMFGTLDRAALRDPQATAADGDVVVLTKGLAVEGTALLARELAARLARLGMSAAELAGCRALSGRLGIIPEAAIAGSVAEVRALHDVTEGGLATAVRELAAACGREVSIRLEAVPILPETRRLCGLLGVDPLGLIGSGSLLIVCAAIAAARLLADLTAAGIPAAAIGELGEAGVTVRATRNGAPAAWPEFARDEAARVLEGAAGIA